MDKLTDDSNVFEKTIAGLAVVTVLLIMALTGLFMANETKDYIVLVIGELGTLTTLLFGLNTYAEVQKRKAEQRNEKSN